MIKRAAHSRRGRRALVAATIAVLAPAGASPIAFAEPAADEYSIDLPGVRDSSVSGDPLQFEHSSPERPSSVQAGVAGETSATGSPLDALGATLADNVPALVAGAALLGAVALAAHGKRSTPR